MEAPAGTGPGIGIPQAGRHAGDCQGIATLLLNSCMGALPGHRHTEASPEYWHPDEVLSHSRHRARVQVLCEDTAALLGYSDTRNMCMARGTGAGYSLPVLVEVQGVGCTSVVPGLRLLQQPPGYSHTDRTRVPSKQHCQGTAAWGKCWGTVTLWGTGYIDFPRSVCIQAQCWWHSHKAVLSHHSTGPQPGTHPLTCRAWR